jgi:hypothetical protein
MEIVSFFSPDDHSGLAFNEDDVVLNAYRLARWYHQNPVVFLEMPLSELQLHVARTEQLRKIQEAVASRDDD